MKARYLILFAAILALLISHSCRKDELLTDTSANLNFSEDTVYFDTVLSTLGSITQYFLIYNPYEQPVEVENIYLAKGSDSFFRLNLDGEKGRSFSKVFIPAKDSLFVFVEVTIDPLDENSPLLIKDSVIFEINSNTQDVKLIAYGQDVNIFNGEIFETQTWTSEKPYLITNSAALDSNEVLTIEEGTHIYLTSKSNLIIWGRVEAQGTFENPIVFSGARLDGYYEESAGQWGTIFFDEMSTDNVLEHVIIKNSTAGIRIGNPGEDTKSSLELRNCMILNSSSVGIWAFNGTIDAYNTIVADGGSLAILFQMGGTYNFYHCTISNISAYYPNPIIGYESRSLPSVIFSNYYDWYDFDTDYRVIDVTYPIDMEVNFFNSIIYGNKPSELYYDSVSDASLNYSFSNNLIKMHSDSLAYFDTLQFESVIFNEDPAFINDSISLGDYNFELDSNSAAINAGSLKLIQGIPQLEFDIKGNPRTGDGYPDLGAYERLE